VLLGAQAPEQRTIWSLADSLKELGFLADTAGIVPVGTVTQNLKQVNPAHYLGKGKVEELAALKEQLGSPYRC
jgi:GTP-binding protein HflX